jgi:RPA family protein
MMSGQQRNRRQSAFRVFAREFYESNLPDGGQGEYDPRFLVTKLGARINRMMVAGLIERMERRETERGTMYRGAVRDPTGLHMWSVGSFRPELHGAMEEILTRFDAGDRFLMICVGKASHYENDEGGIFCSMQMEDYAIVDRDVYARWLVETADHTMRRIDAFGKAQQAEGSGAEALRTAGVPEDLIVGLGLALNHYGEWDPEGYKVGVLQALAAAEGRVVSFEEHEASAQPSQEAPPDAAESGESDDESPAPAAVNIEVGDVEGVVLEIITQQAGSEGINYDQIMEHCRGRGLTDEPEIEDAIKCLLDDRCEIMEPRFGWFMPL